VKRRCSCDGVILGAEGLVLRFSLRTRDDRLDWYRICGCFWLTYY